MLSGIVSSTRKSFNSISELHLHHKLRLVPGSETFPFWSNLTHLTRLGPEPRTPATFRTLAFSAWVLAGSHLLFVWRGFVFTVAVERCS
jgi:hypothetical protein